MCDTGWHPEHMTGTGRLQASLKGNSNWILRSWSTLHQTKRQEKAFLLNEGNWRVERGESSHYTTPPPVSATQQCWRHCCVNSFCSHGTGEPWLSPTSWNHSTVSTLYWWLKDTAQPSNLFFSAVEHLIEPNYPWKTSQKPLLNYLIICEGKSITMSNGSNSVSWKYQTEST